METGSRKVITYTVDRAGRDQGKQYVITEMAAKPAFDWAIRVVAAAINGGADIPQNLHRAGMASLAIAGLAGMRYISGDDIIEFGNELMTCVQFKAPNGDIRKLFDGDIEEFTTYGLLQKKVFDLHVESFTIGVKSTSELTPAPETAPE